ncbi:MAG: 3-phosphoserine/phosphohydroxythreonine transaminase [bacterium]
MKRIYNFSAGPATLPLPVLQEVQQELLDYQGSGMSIMEMSHRSQPYEEVLSKLKMSVRRLLSIPDTHDVLLLQGGASLQFSMVPYNFLVGQSGSAEVVETGVWVQKAIKEMQRLGKVRIVASSDTDEYRSIPDVSVSDFDAEAAYAYLCSNNTIYGTQWKHFPNTGDLPLVADMSSDMMSRPLDISKFSLIFAGAQKNLGPAGVTLVIIRRDWVEKAAEVPASMLSYQTHIKAGSLYNTPPTFAIYVMQKCMAWLESEGGIEVIAKRNQDKAMVLYDFIDSHPFYTCPVRETSRSLMNPVFLLGKGSTELEKLFVQEAAAVGLSGLKGHRLVGGLRASIYNAFPKEGIDALCEFMDAFAKKYA